MNKQVKTASLFFVTALASVGVARLWRMRRSMPPPLPRAETLRRILAERFGTETAVSLCNHIHARYQELLDTGPDVRQRALRWHLQQNILPGIAAYQILKNHLGSREAALAVMDAFIAAFMETAPPRRQMALLKRLPAKFAIFRPIVRWTMRQNYPPEGWEMEWVEDSDKRIAFNVHRCFYLDYFFLHDVPELTATFCRGDDLLFADLPSEIVWERTKTLGRGDACCNFSWQHEANGVPMADSLHAVR